MRDEALIKIEHQKPLLFGKQREQALHIGADFSLEKGPAADGRALVHDETRDNVALAMALASLEPPLPQAFGVLRAIERPTVDQLAREQEAKAAAGKGPKDLRELLSSGDTWDVAEAEEGPGGGD